MGADENRGAAPPVEAKPDGGSIIGSRHFVGREAELVFLARALESAGRASGSAVIVEGPAGSGKTALSMRFAESASESGCAVLRGTARRNSKEPYHPLAEALAPVGGTAFFGKAADAGFTELYLLDAAGAIVAKAGGEAAQGDIPEKMAAIQQFIGDSFAGGAGATLGKIQFGSMSLIVEKADGLVLAGVADASEPDGMREAMRDCLTRMSAGVDAKADLDALLSRRFKRTGMAEEDKLATERVRMAEEVSELLDGLAVDRPALLVVEDVHLADSSTLFMLRHLARASGGMRLLLIVTRRPDEEGSADAWHSSIPRLRLGPLRLEDTASLLSFLYPCSPLEGIAVSAIHERSGGNPLFAQELARSVASSGGQAELASLPGSVAELVRRRFESLEPEALALAECASCAGRVFDPADVVGIASSADGAGAMRELESSGVVTLAGGRGEFASSLFHEHAYTGMSHRWRVANHRRWGELLERRFGAAPEVAAYDLARHFHNAGNHAKSVDYSEMAGDRAASAYAAEQAVEFYTWAVDDAMSGGRPAAELELLLEKLGDTLLWAGEPVKAIERFELAEASAADPHRRAKMARKAAECLDAMGDYRGALDRVDSALDACPSGIESLKLSMAKATVLYRLGDYPLSEKLSLENLAAVRGISESFASTSGGERLSLKLEASVLNSLGLVRFFRADFAQALDFHGRALAIRERLGDAGAIVASLNNIGVIHRRSGKIDEARRNYARALDLARTVKDRVAEATLSMNLGLISMSLGELEDAESGFRSARAIFLRVDDPASEAHALGNLAVVESERGDLGSALADLRTALDARRRSGDRYGEAKLMSHIGHALRQLGDYASASAEFTASEALAREIGAGELQAEATAGVAELAIDAGDVARAETALDALASVVDGHRLASYAVDIDWLKGRMLLLRGNAAEGLAHLEAARPALMKSGRARDLPKLLFDTGQALTVAGRRREGRELLAEAEALFRRFGMARWLDRCRNALETEG